MSDATHEAAHGHDAAHDHAHEAPHASRRTYVIGFLLSAVLTAIPFWLVMSGVLANANLTAGIVVGCAIVQILVHTICFLHVNTQGEGGWTLMAYIFTLVLVLIVIIGSLWIMYHLHANMMPMPGGPIVGAGDTP